MFSWACDRFSALTFLINSYLLWSDGDRSSLVPGMCLAARGVVVDGLESPLSSAPALPCCLWLWLMGQGLQTPGHCSHDPMLGQAGQEGSPALV